MFKFYKNLLILVLLSSMTIFAQNYLIKGKVTSAQSGEALIGANVILKGTMLGGASDADGVFNIKAPAGDYTIVCSYVGFEKVEYDISLTNTMEVDFELNETQFSLSVEVIADRAKERETPVAFAEIDKKDMEQMLGSRDIPMVLNTTPSVYATMQGGGAGDARINVRGFNQRNIAIMINGVPVNDMENGWVYWSNWDGVADATSSIQLQRGLSAVNLATPSIGGTMNVITDPTAAKFGTKFKQEFGAGGFMKSSLFFNSGMIGNKFAVSGGIVRKLGDGVIDKTWTDAWAYYFGASYQINSKNRIELYAIGAPQRHGQNLYRQNAAAYSHEFAKEELGYTDAQLAEYPEASAGRNYNENWGPVSPSYNGKQWLGSETGERYDPGFINERENFYHKPQINLNWYSNLSNKLSLYTTAYYSGGVGGGTGTYGSMRWNYHVGIPSPSRFVAFDATIERNRNSADGSLGILRNSRNNQWTIGAISKAIYKLSDKMKMTVGVDWRTAEIEHYREVRDLLGGAYFRATDSEFWTSAQEKRGLGDKIDYNNTNTVDWLGFFAQTEYTTQKLSLYAMGGYSTISYGYTNHFKKNASGGELTAESDAIGGYQVKGGASFRTTNQFTIYANAGLVSKVPIFDQVIDDGTGIKAADPKNETFISLETGVNFRSSNGKFNANANVYYTTWSDRAQSRTVTNLDGSEGLVFLEGLDSRHMGIEFDAAYQPMRKVRFDAAASFGNWTLTNDISGRYRDYSNNADTEYDYYVKDLKVGDAPQTQLAVAATVFPIKDMSIRVDYRYYADHYADWNPFSRTDINDRAQVWMAPSFGVMDIHFDYYLPIRIKGARFQVFAHIFNVLDEIYVQDATDESRFNAIDLEADGGPAGTVKHSAQRAEIFLGLPRIFNVGLSVEL